jgi:predicted MPP superfamily phosphohydrolase
MSAGTLAGGVVGVGVTCLAWALVEARSYTLRNAQVPVLPPGSRPVTLLHISDLHLVPTQADKRAWVRDLASLEPDLVIDTGDNLAHLEAVPAVLDALEPLLDRPGAFVLGSNDYYAPVMKNPVRYLLRLPNSRTVPEQRELPVGELVAGFTEAGWRDLSNRRDSVSAGGLRFSLVGVDDPHLQRDRFPAPLRQEGSSSEGVIADVHLGVTHAPYLRTLDRMHADGVDLILAGHTHGGQLCIPGFGALVTNCDLDRGRVKGLHGWPGPRPDAPGSDGSTWLHVSGGLGTSPYAPVRFACRPEATLLELVAR